MGLTPRLKTAPVFENGMRSYGITSAMRSLDDKVWDRLIERLNKTLAEESSTVVGQPGFPVRPPRFPERIQPLPSEKYELEKLLRDLDGLIAEFENVQQHDEQIDRVHGNGCRGSIPIARRHQVCGFDAEGAGSECEEVGSVGEFRIIEYASYLKQLITSNSENERIGAAMAKSREPSEQQTLLSLVAKQRDSHAAFDGLLGFLRSLRKEVVTKVRNWPRPRRLS